MDNSPLLQMMPQGFMLAATMLVLGLVGHWWWEAQQHRRRIAALRLRIHVNGIRGKSTVTRLLAGLLRQSGWQTIAKTTGTAAAVIDGQGRDHPLHRRGPATILEQVEVVRRWVPPSAEALVVECMALQPEYQTICEEKIVRSHIGVLTNVREDHQDVMGHSLPEIASCLLRTCPQEGVLITAEQDPELLNLMRRETARRGTRLVVADPGAVDEAAVAQFPYITFPENVAIGFAVADLLGIPRAAALRGMVEAAPDPGVLRLRRKSYRGKSITWANLFAVNDRQSTIQIMQMLDGHRTSDTATVGLLNNRLDREGRALQFADIASRDLDFDCLAALGAYERAVVERLKANGFPSRRILQMGESREQTLEEMLDHLVMRVPDPHILLVGMVNIHTPQATSLLKFLEAEDQSEPTRDLGATIQTSGLPSPHHSALAS